MINMLGAGLLNDPLAVILIAAGIILVAVALILYFLVFRQKIKVSAEKHSAERAEKKKKEAEQKSIVSNAFKKEESVEDSKQAKKDSSEVMKAIQSLSGPNTKTKKGGSK